MNIFQLFLFIVLLCFNGCGNQVSPQPAPPLLPNTEPAMESAQFWIQKNPEPDRLILDSGGIDRLNRYIRDEMKLTEDILSLPDFYPGDALKQRLTAEWQSIKDQQLFNSEGKRAGDGFFDIMLEKLNFRDIAETVPVRYGFIVQYADQRFLPVDQGLYAQKDDLDFDELQNSALDAGTPVAVLHVNIDGTWLYVVSGLTSGWVKRDCVAFAERSEISGFLTARRLVVTSSRAEIYIDPQKTQVYAKVRMGMRFPFIQIKGGDTVQVAIPVPGGEEGQVTMSAGYLKMKDVSLSPLAYTPRNIITQAFKLLHQPYGWGGMHGGQDCSRFIQEVFASVGIELPRNSKEQRQVGEILKTFDDTTDEQEKKILIIKNGAAGSTLLGLKGHIMLYLGSVNGEPYAIHSAWAYRIPTDKGDQTFVINRVVVSDLNLGEGSTKGSWLHRVVSLNDVRFPR